jgi:hypothetical protein
MLTQETNTKYVGIYYYSSVLKQWLSYTPMSELTKSISWINIAFCLKGTYPVCLVKRWPHADTEV